MQVCAWTGCLGAYTMPCLTSYSLKFFTRSLTHPILQAGESGARQQYRANAVHEAKKDPRCAILCRQEGPGRYASVAGEALHQVLDLARAHSLEAIIWLLDSCTYWCNGAQPASWGCGCHYNIHKLICTVQRLQGVCPNLVRKVIEHYTVAWLSTFVT